MCQQGYQAQGGQIIDATLIPVPKRRDSEPDKQQLAAGETPQSWQNNPHRAAQKDGDGRWTKKGNVSHFGYKDHISVEHVFGGWVMQMGGKLLHSIGLDNAKAHLGLKNLTYNLLRYSFWQAQATV